GVFSLQEVAGPLVISVPIGGSNSAQWRLLNDGDQAITVSLTATGDAAKYLSFPATKDLPPGEIVYISITASVPSDYNLGQNITGFLYALQEGQPGQVKINIQLMKSVTIMVTGQSTTSTTSTTAPSAASFVNAGGGGGYVSTTCKQENYVCDQFQYCCAGLTCQNGICVASTTPTTTTAVPTTTTTTTTQAPTTTTTITPSPISSPITGFMVFASSPLGTSLLLSLVVATVLIIIFYKKRYNKEKPEGKKLTTF
ncbi:MAG: hypothetical protein NTW30_03945, partial [Candidatus Aenigmarchaeota archaeon]|nr:hypothetical protein [Candidatus Aenigmarchaeota archaeon]